MPPELMELYQLYQQELATRNEKEANYLSELNVMLRVSLKFLFHLTIYQLVKLPTFSVSINVVSKRP